MKTLNHFFSAKNESFRLSNAELTAVRGGDNPPTPPGDPFFKDEEDREDGGTSGGGN